MSRVSKMDLLAYVRVSTEEQKKAGTHKTQMDEISRWASHNEHNIIGWYTDLATSGKDVRGRPEFIKLNKDIIRKADGIVAYRLDRLGRSVLDLLVFVKLVCDQLKKGFFCVKDNIDTTTHMGRFFLQVLASIAELNRNIIRENTEAGRRRVRENGGRLGGPIPREIKQKMIERELRKGESPERIGRFVDPPVSGATIRRRMKEFGIYAAYRNGEYFKITDNY